MGEQCGSDVIVNLSDVKDRLFWVSEKDVNIKVLRYKIWKPRRKCRIAVEAKQQIFVKMQT